MHLSDLLDTDHQQKENPVILGVSCDSRQISAGYVFVAIKGTSEDGNRFINDAIKNGAVAVVTDQHVAAVSDPNIPVITPVITVDDSRLALARIANRLHRKKPNLMAAITGTNGKTSVAEFLRQIW